jgi:hypothetical protein
MNDMETKKALLLMVAALALATGCQKIRSGANVTFRVTSGEAATRTAYSGIDGDGNPVGAGSTYERIDWSDGDWIGIYCAQATRLYGNPSLLADYSILSHEAKSNTVSSAEIGPAGDPNGLQWGSGEHKFYAVYPSPNSPQFTDTEKEKVSLDGSSFKGFTPAAQTLTQKGSTAVWLPQMQYAWMFARTVVSQPQTAVNLSFEPEFTAIEFSIGTGDNTRVDLSSFTLSTTASGYALAGEFTIPVETATTESTFTWANTSQSVTIDFTGLPGGKLTVQQGTPFVFTVLLLPREVKNLWITFTGDQIGTRKLAISDGSGNTLVFQGRHKYRLYGFSFPYLMTATGEDIIWDHEATGEGIIWSENANGERIEWNQNGHGGNVNWGQGSGGGDLIWD